MKSVQTAWTKTGVTASDVTAKVSGPSPTEFDIVVPKGTAVHFIGHWAVYGITIPETDVTDIKDVAASVAPSAAPN